MTVRWLSRTQPTPPSHTTTGARVILCTGEIMEELVGKLYPGVRATSYEPRHTQDRLSNEFRCFANFTCDGWKWR